MEVAQAIKTKRAVRAFTDEPIPDSQLEAIVNAGRRAQSSKNSQPWRFLAIRERTTLAALSQLGTYAGHLAGAAAAVAILTPPPSERWSIMFDAGQAAAYMQLAGWDLGIASCLATIYQSEAARELLGFPETYQVNAAISFGYPLDRELLHALPKAGGRRSLSEILVLEHWSS
jgi:nitroreductase